MDRARLLALRQEAERCLESELEHRYPDLAQAFEVRLAVRTNGVPDPSAEHIDW